MCGINGIFAYHPASATPDDRELLATRDAMAARGPDGEGAWRSGDRRCAFGHRRLAILDLSGRAAQPMCSEDGRLAIVFNGEIYNYPELRAEFEARGIRLRTNSDTEILLYLYAECGAGMVARLRGMFAFAIWDENRKGLFLARDPYGIKPLYTANDGWTFRFASQVQALMAGGNLSRESEPAGVVGFHLFGSVPEPFTMYRDVRALPAGHTQWIGRIGPSEPRQYANVSAILREGARSSVAPGEIDIRIRAATLDSVRHHLLADVEVGLFLSSGVDSSALLGLMRDAGQENVRAITLAFDQFRDTADDEAPLAALVADHYGAKHFVRRVAEDEFRDDLPRLLAAMDQPSIDGVNTWFVAKAAREAGLKVALSGLGADELLAGYPTFTELPRWKKRLSAVAAPGLGKLARLLMQQFAPGLVGSKPKAAGVLEYGRSWPGLYLLRRGLFLPHELRGVMDPEFAAAGLRRLKPLQLLASELNPDPGTDIARVCALESQHYLRNQLLRDADWAGMAHSIEIRTPFVDSTVLKNLAAVIPQLSNRAGKLALTRAPSVPLPRLIANRRKTGFAVPTAAWMASAVGRSRNPGRSQAESKGLTSRRWSQFVFAHHLRTDELRDAA